MARCSSSATSASATPRPRSSCRASPAPSDRCCSPPREGRLPADAPPRLPELPDAAVGIVLAAKGYPGDPRRGDPIRGLETAAAQGALVFHAGTFGRPDGGFGTNGGRVLTVVGRGPDLMAAREAAERAAGRDRLGRHAAPRRHRRRPAGARGGARMIPRYTLPEMGALWTEQARFERMLEVEIAVCRAQVGAWPRARGGAGGDRGEGARRRRPHRRDRAHHRPRRDRLRVAGRRDRRVRTAATSTSG